MKPIFVVEIHWPQWKAHDWKPMTFGPYHSEETDAQAEAQKFMDNMLRCRGRAPQTRVVAYKRVKL